MVFLWFSYGFPMVYPELSIVNRFFVLPGNTWQHLAGTSAAAGETQGVGSEKMREFGHGFKHDLMVF